METASNVNCETTKRADGTILGTSKRLPDVIAELGATKAFIITGKSLYEKTPVIKDIETTLGSAHGGTFNKIGQHACVRRD